MEKKYIEQIGEIVKRVLTEDGKSRNSDDYLYMKVCKIIAEERGFVLERIPVTDFFGMRKAYGFPPFESVRRSRQKCQAEDELLRADRCVKDAREENEQVYKEYARSKA